MEIRLVRKDEYNKLIEFIDTYWRKGHCLVKSKMLFDWQHENADCYNFYAAFDNDTIVSVLGFISPSHHDNTLDKNSTDYWGAIWKTIESPKYIGVGMSLMKKLFKSDDFNSYAALGISDIASSLYKVLRMKVSRYNQYYIANKNISEYKIAYNPKHNESAGVNNEDWSIQIKYDITSTPTPDYKYLPAKNKSFFVNRYQLHPIYKYVYLFIYNKDVLVNVWVVRRLVVEGTSILRVQDVMGDLTEIPNMYKQIQDLLTQESCEYIDFINYGLPNEIFSKIGFCELDVDSEETIIPNYFEPFLRKNINIGLAYKADFDYVAFKADGDQDRPSIL